MENGNMAKYNDQVLDYEFDRVNRYTFNNFKAIETSVNSIIDGVETLEKSQGETLKKLSAISKTSAKQTLAAAVIGFAVYKLWRKVENLRASMEVCNVRVETLEDEIDDILDEKGSTDDDGK